MNREVHVRIWERPEVRLLRATRQEEPFPARRLRATIVSRVTVAAGTRLATADDKVRPATAQCISATLHLAK
jgi:hypothetical protein